MKFVSVLFVSIVIAAAVVIATSFASAQQTCKLRVGRPAPVFRDAPAVFANSTIGKISLDTYAKQGRWTLFMTLPLAFTFVCTTEIIELSNAFDELQALNAVAIGMTVDSVYSLDAWRRMPQKEGGIGSVTFPMISDIKKEISRDYNVLIEDEGIDFRGTFIIDPQGVLRFASIQDLPVGRSIPEAIRLIRAFQFADKTGNVCPSKWKTEGDRTIIPDPEKKKEFFSAEYTN